MNKILFALPLLLLSFCAANSFAEEVTIKGKITCAKCDLKVADKCATVIVAKEGDKDVTYYLDAAGNKANHKEICTSPKNGSVTGVKSVEGDKNIITVSKVEFDK